MIGYIYKTTNTINNKVYIGKHYGSQYDEKYFGSGKILCTAIKKYGIQYFTNEIIDTADSEEELNQKEIKHISHYKSLYGRNCYNIANGGTGGDVFKYSTQEEKDIFKEKMTKINQERCSSKDFKRKLSIATSKRYEDKNERIKHSEKIKKSWSSLELKQQQSERLTEYYKTHKRDCSFNFIPCMFKLNGLEIKFDSIKDLRKYLLDEYKYSPARKTLHDIMDMGKHGIPYHPFHKSNQKLQKLDGMLIYKLDKGVETNDDECSRVG